MSFGIVIQPTTEHADTFQNENIPVARIIDHLVFQIFTFQARATSQLPWTVRQPEKTYQHCEGTYYRTPFRLSAPPSLSSEIQTRHPTVTIGRRRHAASICPGRQDTPPIGAGLTSKNINLLASILAISILLPLTIAQSPTSTAQDPTITASPPQTTDGYVLNDCPSAAGADFALCALSISDVIWISPGACQGVATKGDDDVFSSCHCRMMVEWGPCYETVCPQSVMARYSSSETITADAGRAAGWGRGGADGWGRSGSKNGVAGVAAPLVFPGLVVGAGVLAALL
ncbi:hypothetical protein B0T18DRAFT_388677 [Schizothecium vesticola]|uniref:Uncharacterized protein n=1 Tax=Schizothecium vesticola TaxID=314040 RepID=A0AA40K7N1_9PEZI|nr:hypothetical protein B0T18DRAFT_388677 [Schizothecium vesticola]